VLSLFNISLIARIRSQYVTKMFPSATDKMYKTDLTLKCYSVSAGVPNLCTVTFRNMAFRTRRFLKD